jgi:hypothetical protein
MTIYVPHRQGKFVNFSLNWSQVIKRGLPRRYDRLHDNIFTIDQVPILPNRAGSGLKTSGSGRDLHMLWALDFLGLGAYLVKLGLGAFTKSVKSQASGPPYWVKWRYTLKANPTQPGRCTRLHSLSVTKSAKRFFRTHNATYLLLFRFVLQLYVWMPKSNLSKVKMLKKL